LAGCANLRQLWLQRSGVTDVSALASCARLHTLDLRGCRSVTGLSALGGLANLRHSDDYDSEEDGDY